MSLVVIFLILGWLAILNDFLQILLLFFLVLQLHDILILILILYDVTGFVGLLATA